MKITFLGTAAATAMPLPFCNCEVCLEGKRLKGKDIRRRSSIVINEDILIDLGPDTVNASLQYDIDLSKINYILQTHAHSDHFDAGHLITRHPDYAVSNVKPITLVSSNKTIIAMNDMLKREYGQADIFNEKFKNKLKISIYETSFDKTIQLGDYKITSLNSFHDINQQAQVYIISHNNQNILYGTDILSFDDVFRYLIYNNIHLDLVILDQTYGQGYNSGGHLNANQVIDIVNKLKELNIVTMNTPIYATHISHEGNFTHNKMEKLAKKHQYSIAYDGLIVEL